MASGTPLLRLEQIAKHFGAIEALRGVSFDVDRGEVVALLGDNGAGKSTLVKIIAGGMPASAGRILFEGSERVFASPHEAKEAGIETVYQDLSLCTNVDVVANFFMGRELTRKILGVPVLRERDMQAETAEALASAGTHIPSLRTNVEHLSGGQRQAIELNRFVHWGGKLVLLDEPSLSANMASAAACATIGCSTSTCSQPLRMRSSPTGAPFDETSMTSPGFGTHGAGGGLALDPQWLTLPVSLALAIAIGAAVGTSNGILVVRFGINAFIVTLAAYIWVRGLVVAMSGGRSVYGLPDAMRWVAVHSFLGVPMLAWMLILTFLVFSFILTKTPFGRHLTLIGGNPTAAYRAGIRVDRAVFLTFVTSGAIAGFAGWLLSSRTAGATANLGIGMLFEAFAAVVIGGVSLKGGYGRLSGVFAGVLLLSSIQTAINVWGMPPHYTQMIRGGLVLAAVLLDTAKTHIRRRYL